MTKELTLKEIVDFMTLDLAGQRFKRTVAFYLVMNQNLLRPYYEAFEQQRQELLQKYGRPENENIVVPPDQVQDFLNEMRQLLDSKITTALSLIRLEDLPEELDFDVMRRLMIVVQE